MFLEPSVSPLSSCSIWGGLSSYKYSITAPMRVPTIETNSTKKTWHRAWSWSNQYSMPTHLMDLRRWVQLSRLMLCGFSHSPFSASLHLFSSAVCYLPPPSLSYPLSAGPTGLYQYHCRQDPPNGHFLPYCHLQWRGVYPKHNHPQSTCPHFLTTSY